MITADTGTLHINNCSFYEHETQNIAEVKRENYSARSNKANSRILIENSRFEKNDKTNRNCSCLHASDVDVILVSMTFIDNNCTGIVLTAANITVHKWVNMTKNNGLQGGAIQMLSKKVSQTMSLSYITKSKIILSTDSELNMVNNSALTYGGGIYNGDKCDDENTKDSLSDGNADNSVIRFAGNDAKLGGDATFGGCLSECHINNNDIYAENNQSLSTFATHPSRVVFCAAKTCSSEKEILAYRGEEFRVQLMIVDNCCVPSVGVIRAKLSQESSECGGIVGGESYKRSNKSCESYSYAIEEGNCTKQSSIVIEFFIHCGALTFSSSAQLTVNLAECPKGFEFVKMEKECLCNDLLKSLGVECFPRTHFLAVPHSTWLGEVEKEEAYNKYCQYCHKEGVEKIENFTYTDSLCSPNRTGILCGACATGLSLQLGSYNCADCSNSEYKGVMLIIVFMVVGIGLVILLLGLNLTVSTGVINGLIFYCNVVHSHGDSLLPMTHHTNQTHLNNVIKFLSTFQSWMNLDFGIVTCFFNNYNTYTSNWMQFVFPLYICLLILIIVMASRHSSRVSRLTGSNTVPVLATLLLLSYSKLLTTSIEGASYTEIQFLDKNTGNYKVWVMDGNVRYLKGKHIPLFLMSIITVVAILPFTLLILLGPLLQARSHHRPLHWINKMKPFLDAFYGPYTSRYRYWPGILLLVRMIILGSFAFYSLGDSHFKLLMVSVMILVLFVIWITLGRSYTLSLYQSKGLNFLEMFFLLNLGVFAVGSIYTRYTKSQVVYQQILALLMVGSVFITFCGIILCQIFTMSSISKAIRRRIAHLIPKRITERATASEADKTTSYNRRLDNVEECSVNVDGSTQTTVEMGDIDRPSCELREPLLDD